MLKGNNFLYITTNPKKTVLYTGVTNNLAVRLQQHYTNRVEPETFSGEYCAYRLLYYERFTDINQAIAREKDIKDLSRESKIQLIKEQNPHLDFLAENELEKTGNSFLKMAFNFQE